MMVSYNDMIILTWGLGDFKRLLKRDGKNKFEDCHTHISRLASVTVTVRESLMSKITLKMPLASIDTH